VISWKRPKVRLSPWMAHLMGTLTLQIAKMTACSKLVMAPSMTSRGRGSRRRLRTRDGFWESCVVFVDGSSDGNSDTEEGNNEGSFESVTGHSDCKNEGMPVHASIGAICSLT